MRPSSSAMPISAEMKLLATDMETQGWARLPVNQ